MTLDKSGAAEALAEIGQSQKRSANLYSYAATSPYLLLTGAMWLAADLLLEFTTFGKHWAWPIVSLVSIPAYIAIAIYQSRRRSSRPASLDGHFWRGIAIWLLIFGFVAGALGIFWPESGVQVHSFIGLLTGIAWAIAGLWMGWRIIALGLGIAALTMAGHFWVHDFYAAYMGLVGGGGMMLGALWLRRV